MPKTWKLPRYRHASYTDQFSSPERAPKTFSENDEFRDPPDIRFPNVWDKKRNPFETQIASLIRPSAGLRPRANVPEPGAVALPPGGK